ncbi:MAG: hypothetical protein KatS3mg060_1969 [Dehalococcoidia bacterium]|nr:MAG: hypothetical protein KatS3mg060_1969 [Dehalococcoidia bacterium]
MGQEATVSFSSLAGTVYRGTIQSIAPTATVVNGVSTYSVVIALDTKGEELLGGLSGTAQILVQRKTDALLVPTWAVQSSGGRRAVTVRQPDGTTETREVQVGISDGLQTEIVSGVREGEVVVATTAGTTRTTATTGGGSPPVVVPVPGGGPPAGGGRPPGGGG